MTRSLSQSLVAAALLCLLAPAARAEGESGVSPSRLSLPSGPGSLEGVGENVTPNLNMGLAAYSVPIDVPPGQRGLSPAVSLGYGSGGGASVVGLGWSFGMPTIERMTSEGLPRYTADDQMAANGGDELVRLPGTDIYRSRFESGFVRYRWHDAAGDGRNGYWTAEQPDGNVWYFGARADGSLAPDARMSGARGTFRWHLTEMVDPFGHRVLYTYEKDGALSLPSRVSYAFDANGTPRYVIAFAYEPRVDHLTDAKPGFVTKLTKRLETIEIRSAGVARRTYEMQYQTEAQAGALTKLAAVYTYGLGGAGPYPIVFRFDYSDQWWSGCEDGACRRPFVKSLSGSVGVDFRTGRADLIDMNGDGLPDVLDTTDGRHVIHVNEITPSGTHRFRAPLFSTKAGSGSATLGAPNVQMVDLDGNGFTDLVDGNNGVVYRNHGMGDWDAAIALPATLPDFAGDADLRFFDWNGDKASDVLHADPSATWVWENDRAGNYADDPTFTDDALGLGFTTDGIQLADMNGDGLQDVTLVLDAEVAYRPNMGWGRFGDWIEMTGFPAVLPSEVTLIDIDGDSLSDAVVVLGNEVRYTLNRSGTHFGNIVVIDDAGVDGESMPERTSDISVRFADMNGNGSTDVVWIDASGKVTYLELAPIRPNILTRVRNGIGKVIELAYASSVQEMARDGGPTAWSRRLPQVHQVLKVLTHFDSLSGVRQRQEIYYHNGYFDGVEQQFRGFEDVEVVTTGDDSIETGTILHTFDVGVTDRYRHGLTLRTETRSAAKALLVETFEHGDCPIAEIPDGVTPAIRHVCQKSMVKEVREGRPASEWARIREESEHDGYGNVIRSTKHGVVTIGGSACAPCDRPEDVFGAPCGAMCLGDEQTTETTYVPPSQTAGRWILRAAMREVAYGRPGSEVFSEKLTHYDGDAFVGLPLGQLTAGLPSRVLELVEPGRYIASARSRYDAHGNIIEAMDALGHVRRFGYDPLGLFAIEERLVLDDRDSPYDLVMKTEVDIVRGKTSSATGWVVYEDGVAKTPTARTTFHYDDHHRLVGQSGPTDPPGSPGSVYEYDLADPTSRIVVKRRSREGQALDLEDTLCIDGHGRVYQRRTPRGDGQYDVHGFTLYNAAGSHRRGYLAWVSPTAACDQVASGTAPHFSIRRDALGRVTERTSPDTADHGSPSVERVEQRPLAEWRWDPEDMDPASPHHNTPFVVRRNGLGQVVRYEQLDADGSVTWSTELTYDELGRFRGMRDIEGNERLQVFDRKGRLVVSDDPDSGITTFEYDDEDQLVRQVNAAGDVMRFAYDEVGRLSSQWAETDPAGTRIVQHYDRPVTCGSTCTWTAGRRVEVSFPIDGGGRLRATEGRQLNGFDAYGTPVRSVTRLGGQTFSFELEPDRAGRIVRTTLPGGAVVEFEHDDASRVIAIPGYVDRVAYAPDGVITRVSYANGVETTYAANAMRRLTAIRTIGPSGLVLQDDTIDRDRLGNVRAIQDLAPRADGSTRSASFTYDDLYRLSEASYDEGTVRAEKLSFAYDRIDNLVGMVSTLGEGSRAHVGALTYGGDEAGPHAVVGAGDETYAYDDAGRMSRHGQDTYTWDFMGRLTAVHRGAARRVHVIYGEGEERLAKVESKRLSLYLGDDFEIRDGVATFYLSVGDQRVVKIERAGLAASVLGDLAPLQGPGAGTSPTIAPDGKVTAADAMIAYRLEQQLIALVAPDHDGAEGMLAAAVASQLIGPTERVTFLHHDVVGSTVLTTDAEGHEVQRTEYYPFGETRSTTKGWVEQYSFAGKERDPGSGLSYFGARYLDPRIGRWISPDVTFASVAADGAGTSEAFNRYLFALNNPLSFRDEKGAATMNNFNRNGNSAGLSAGNVAANYSHMHGFAWKIRVRERGAYHKSPSVQLSTPAPTPAPPLPKADAKWVTKAWDTKPEAGKTPTSEAVAKVMKALEGSPGPHKITTTGRTQNSLPDYNGGKGDVTVKSVEANHVLAGGRGAAAGVHIIEAIIEMKKQGKSFSATIEVRTYAGKGSPDPNVDWAGGHLSANTKDACSECVTTGTFEASTDMSLEELYAARDKAAKTAPELVGESRAQSNAINASGGGAK